MCVRSAREGIFVCVCCYPTHVNGAQKLSVELLSERGGGCLRFPVRPVHSSPLTSPRR